MQEVASEIRSISTEDHVTSTFVVTSYSPGRELWCFAAKATEDHTWRHGAFGTGRHRAEPNRPVLPAVPTSLLATVAAVIAPTTLGGGEWCALNEVGIQINSRTSMRTCRPHNNTHMRYLLYLYRRGYAVM